MPSHRSAGSVHSQSVKHSEIRPIGARALKSAIDTLRPWLPQSRVLDLFAGLGRFGIATLKEEAGLVTFVEVNSKAAESLRRAIHRDRDRARVERSEVFAFLKKAKEDRELFDIVFADPPFPLWNESFAQMLSSSVLDVVNSESIFLVKHPARMLPSLATYGFAEWKTTRFGESKLIYLKSQKSL
jgi:16S rRNA (guanine966-N2)-methyltransferase